MLYCPPNVTFFTIWYQRAFNLCFVETVSVLLLSVIMLIFGTAELFMYRRHGTKLDAAWLKPLPKLYVVQLVCNSFLLCCPFIWLGLRYWSAEAAYGYMITYNLLAFYVWSMSLWLLILERNFDLPTPPGAGHSVLLNCFWGLALALDSLCFVNFNGDQWYFIFHSPKDRVLLAVFVIRWICTFLLFVLGMLAPGMVSIERRGQFTYRELAEGSSKYGSTTTVESSTSANEFVASVERLKAQLSNGDLQLGFRSAYRQKAGQSVDAALKRENASKNRYSNVLPYDYNRVLLKPSKNSASGGDYVNASWITVRLSRTSSLNSSPSVEQRYIATQGPMQTTIIDFWRMVFEQRVHTVVMLTELIESELPKCHQYWPEIDATNGDAAQEYGSLLVSCIRTDYNKGHVIREFSLIHVTSQVELTVVQIQFKGWPDHGVPKKAQLFLDFLDLVHSVAPEHQNEKPSPLLVHCSAGIGRTGVYIMAETLAKSIDTGVPLRPLEFMQTLRDQRMGMVQTEQQFLFVCELAVKYYDKRSSSRRN